MVRQGLVLPQRNTPESKYGKSILLPSQNSQANPGTQRTRKEAIVGTGPATQPAADRPTLGIEVIPNNGPVRGLKVVNINDSSRADEAGLRLGDLIVAVDGKATPTVAEIAQLLQARKNGDTIRAEIVRGEARSQVSLPLMAKAAVASSTPEKSAPESLPLPSPSPAGLGIEIGPSDGNRGVIVNQVAENSPAANAGIKVGDRIVSVNGRLLVASDSLSDEVANLKPGDEIAVKLVRDGKLVSADVTMLDPTAVAKSSTKQAKQSDNSVLGGIGSVLGGLFGGEADATGKPAPNPFSASPKDEMAFGDNEPVKQAGFEGELKKGEAKNLKNDPPSLETLDLPTDAAKAIELDPATKSERPRSAKDARERIQQLRQQLKQLEAYLQENPE